MTSNIFRVFLSSTFSDMTEERNALHKEVFPKLRELCTHLGRRFQVVDLRWGVSDEAGLDHRTVGVCLDEITRCQRVTPNGPNFILLLGDRYGWCPPPVEIPADEFESILELVPDEQRELVSDWYRRDDNAVPPSYILQRRDEEFVDYTIWEPIERQLQKVFETAVQKLSLPNQQLSKYVASATEQEIQRGLFAASNANQHGLCFLRTIEGLPEDGQASKYLDLNEVGTVDSIKQAKLHALKTTIRTQLPEDHLYEYTVGWTERGITKGHINQLCSDVYDKLAVLIECESAQIQTVDLLEAEVTVHKAFGWERARVFVGRTASLQTIRGYLDSSDKYLLAIYGVAGIGKSALMAKAIEQTQQSFPNASVVYRFIGATPGTSNISDLLATLCRELMRLYGIEEVEVPSQFKDLVPVFKEKLALASSEKPLILFLDALDQLSNQDDAHHLFWLPEQLPDHVRLVVSTLPGDCLTALEKKIPASNLTEVTRSVQK